MTVEIDREAIARYGLSVSDVQEVVAVAMGGREAGQVFEGDRRFDLIVRLPDSLRGKIRRARASAYSASAIGRAVAVRAASRRRWPGPVGHADEAGFIPVGHVAKVDIAEGTNQISRENGKRRIVVQAQCARA